MVKVEDTLNKWTLLSLNLLKALHKEHFSRPHTLKCECEITLTSDLSHKNVATKCQPASQSIRNLDIK